MVTMRFLRALDLSKFRQFFIGQNHDNDEQSMSPDFAAGGKPSTKLPQGELVEQLVVTHSRQTHHGSPFQATQQQNIIYEHMFLSPTAWSKMCSVNGVCICQVYSQTCPGVEIQLSMIIRVHARRQRKPTEESRAHTSQRSVYHTFVSANAPANHICAGIICNQR